MKTQFARTGWVIPVLGIALVAGTLAVATAYQGLEQRTHDAEALAETLGRLHQDQEMSLVLKAMHDGDVKEATRRLDYLLCADILRVDAELPTVDARTRVFMEDAFRRMARTRPNVATRVAAGPSSEVSDSQVEVERILTGFLKSAQTAQAH